MAEVLELTPGEVQARMKAGDRLVLVDVRAPEEFALARIQDAKLLPMQSVPGEVQRLEALAETGDLIVICHHGVRSLQVTAWLRQQGLENCFSLAGGIDRWSREIDPSVPRY